MSTPSTHSRLSSSSIRPTVAVAFDVDFNHSMQIYQGVSTFAAEKTNWNILPLQIGFEGALAELVRSRQIDGIIGSFISDSWLDASGITDFPVVSISQLSLIETVPSVGVDFQAAGQKAAHYLQKQGVTSFGFVGVTGQYFSGQLQAGFGEGLKPQAVQIAPATNGPALQNWLRTLPKPCAILAAHDNLARKVTQAARIAAISIPEELIILGTGNSSLESMHAEIGLSSIPLPGAEIGRAAAEILERQMNEPNLPQKSVLLPANEIVERESSRRASEESDSVTHTRHFIAEHLDLALDVSHLAARAGISRRSLELRFRQQLGRSPYQEITRQRMQLAQHLLQKTEQRIHQISHACGFPTQHAFSAAFKKHCGMSPRAFREQANR